MEIVFKKPENEAHHRADCGGCASHSCGGGR